MQFKNPELLWALLLLIIPILIHLFQLRKFKKTAFTNVKMLQKVVVESRKSKSIKKWLLLITRLLIFLMLILAFAQPFFAKHTALQEKETVIYVDNSFSMQAKKGNITLLESALQDLLKQAPNAQNISLFTNNSTYLKTTLSEIRNELLALPFSKNQLDLNDVKLKGATLFSKNKSSIKNLVIISDFQAVTDEKITDTTANLNTHLIRISPTKLSNISVDNVYLEQDSGENITINAALSTASTVENSSVSVYNNNKLIAKTSASFNENKKALVTISLPNYETVLGRIEIEDDGLDYDNHFYFSLNKKDKIKVLAISNLPNTYLSRIYTEDEFEFTSKSLKTLNYSVLENQNVIILDELENIPDALQKALTAFTKNNGTLIVIPNENKDLSNYNTILNNYNSTYTLKQNTTQEITTINFDHPLYSGVFNKKISNFQYPKVESYYGIKSNLGNILSYANTAPFLVGNQGIYFFTSALSGNNSNFKNSPLIVPTFYKMGVESLKQENLYNFIDDTNSIDIAVQLPKDEVLKVAKQDYEFIPQQQPFLNKVALTFLDNPKEDGNYNVITKTKVLRNISFNYPRLESKLVYFSLDNLNATTKQESIANLFENLEKDNRVDELWKWFVILALLFALIEIGIQKYFK